MKPEPLEGKERFYHGDKIGCFADWEIKSAVEWLKEQMLKLTQEAKHFSFDLVYSNIDKAFADVMEKKE